MYEKEKGDSRHPHRLELIHVALVYSIKNVISQTALT